PGRRCRDQARVADGCERGEAEEGEQREPRLLTARRRAGRGADASRHAAHAARLSRAAPGACTEHPATLNRTGAPARGEGETVQLTETSRGAWLRPGCTSTIRLAPRTSSHRGAEAPVTRANISCTGSHASSPGPRSCRRGWSPTSTEQPPALPRPRHSEAAARTAMS